MLCRGCRFGNVRTIGCRLGRPTLLFWFGTSGCHHQWDGAAGCFQQLVRPMCRVPRIRVKIADRELGVWWRAPTARLKLNLVGFPFSCKLLRWLAVVLGPIAGHVGSLGLAWRNSLPLPCRHGFPQHPQKGWGKLEVSNSLDKLILSCFSITPTARGSCYSFNALSNPQME